MVVFTLNIVQIYFMGLKVFIHVPKYYILEYWLFFLYFFETCVA